MVSADQKPLVATEASPPSATAMARSQAGVACSTVRPIFQRLGPAGGRGVLGADPAAHRQRRGAGRVREVEHHADVAAGGIAPVPRHGRAERVDQVDAEGQQDRAGAVIAADRVARIVQPRAQQDLRQIVAAGGKLVEHLLLRRQHRLLQRVEGARKVQQIGNAAPVEAGIGRVRQEAGLLEGESGHRVVLLLGIRPDAQSAHLQEKDATDSGKSFAGLGPKPLDLRYDLPGS